MCGLWSSVKTSPQPHVHPPSPRISFGLSTKRKVRYVSDVYLLQPSRKGDKLTTDSIGATLSEEEQKAQALAACSLSYVVAT
jgi:hypothetical protein